MGLAINPSSEFWRAKRVLVTGHTGFKGSWLCLWLRRLGAEVGGLALPPSSSPNLFEAADIGADLTHFECDIRDHDKTQQCIRAFDPEIVFHLAAQALVRPSYDAPVDTFATNIMGTVHVLDALRQCNSITACVVATTDKVYRNTEMGIAFSEDDPLGGHDPYSASKAATEMVVDSYKKSFFDDKGIGIAAARAGNAIGGGDWSPERLIPDAVKAWHAGETLQVRRPSAVRPWQHVLEPLYGYLRLAESIWDNPQNAQSFNFGPNADDVHAVRHMIELAREAFGQGDVDYAQQMTGPHEAGLLSLDNSKAKKNLGVAPRWQTDEAIAQTMNWYRRFYKGTSARKLCDADIDAFEASR